MLYTENITTMNENMINKTLQFTLQRIISTISLRQTTYDEQEVTEGIFDQKSMQATEPSGSFIHN